MTDVSVPVPPGQRRRDRLPAPGVARPVLEEEAGRTSGRLDQHGRVILDVVAKTVKNRVHLDLTADDLDGERARLVELGARVVTGVMLRDPEGNEFCLFP